MRPPFDRRHLAIVPGDASLDLDGEEVRVLGEVLVAAYRRQHREVFEASLGLDQNYYSGAQQRLELLARLLRKCGLSVEAVER